MSNAKGIDISVYQSSTPTLAGLDFIFARATYATSGDGKYAMHFANAEKADCVIGAYHFGVGGAQASVSAQVAAFLAAVGDADILALDLEKNGTGVAMTPAEASSFIVLLRSLDPKKRKIGLYHSASGYPTLGQDFNWVANWNPTPPSTPWTFWQFRGSPLDLDQFNGDRAALLAWVGIADPALAHRLHLLHVLHVAAVAARLHVLHVLHVLHLKNKQ